MFKDFFMKKTNWGYPWQEKATKFQQWYTFIVCCAGIYAISYWIGAATMALMALAENKFEKPKKVVMGEEETE